MTREDHLEVLFNDLCFDRPQRNRWLTAEMGRTIKYLDDLTGAEQSACIDKLKAMKPAPVKARVSGEEDEE